MICQIHTVNILCLLRYLVLAELLDFSVMLLIPLDATGSDLPSLPVPLSFNRQLMVVVFGKVCRVPKHFPLFLKLSPIF